MGLFNQDTEDIEIAVQLRPGTPFWEECISPRLTKADSFGLHDFYIRANGNRLHINNANYPFGFIGSFGINKYFPKISGLKFSGNLNLEAAGLYCSFDLENIKYIEAPTVYLSYIKTLSDLTIVGEYLSCYGMECLRNADLTNTSVVLVGKDPGKFDNCIFNPQTVVHYNLEMGDWPDIHADTIEQINNYKQQDDSLSGFTVGTGQETICQNFEYAFKYSVYELTGISSSVECIHVAFRKRGSDINLYFRPNGVGSQCCTKDGWSAVLTF